MFLTGKVASVPLTVTDTLSSVDVTTVSASTLDLSTTLLSGMKFSRELRSLTLLPVEAQSHHLLMKTVTDSSTYGRTSTLVT